MRRQLSHKTFQRLNQTKLEDMIINLACAKSDLASQNLILLHRKIKLPQLKLPQFDESCDKWPTFHDMFNSIIYSNK